MELKRIPAAPNRCCACESGSRNIIPQAELAGSADEQIGHRDIRGSSVAEEIDLARITDQVKVDARVTLTVAGRERLLGVCIAVCGIASCGIRPAMY